MNQPKITTGSEIFLTTHNGQRTPAWFDVVTESAKAVNLKNQNTGEHVWLPKSSIKWNEKYLCFYIVDWFRKKMEIRQLSILQG